MKSSSNKRKDLHTIIVGCGQLGSNLANTLSDDGGDIIVIDKDPGAFHRLSPSFDGIVMAGDATDISVLQDAQIEKAATVISVTNNDNTNIMVAQLAKELYNIGEVIARLYEPERECVYREFGIDTICPAVLSAREIGRLLGEAKAEEVSP